MHKDSNLGEPFTQDERQFLRSIDIYLRSRWAINSTSPSSDRFRVFINEDSKRGHRQPITRPDRLTGIHPHLLLIRRRHAVFAPTRLRQQPTEQRRVSDSRVGTDAAGRCHGMRRVSDDGDAGVVAPFRDAGRGRAGDLPERGFGLGHLFEQRFQPRMPVRGQCFRDRGRWSPDQGVVVVRWLDHAGLSTHRPPELDTRIVHVAWADIRDSEDSALGIGVVCDAPHAFPEAFESVRGRLAVDASGAGIVHFQLAL